MKNTKCFHTSAVCVCVSECTRVARASVHLRGVHKSRIPQRESGMHTRTRGYSISALRRSALESADRRGRRTSPYIRTGLTRESAWKVGGGATRECAGHSQANSAIYDVNSMHAMVGERRARASFASMERWGFFWRQRRRRFTVSFMTPLCYMIIVFMVRCTIYYVCEHICMCVFVHTLRENLL